MGGGSNSGGLFAAMVLDMLMSDSSGEGGRRREKDYAMEVAEYIVSQVQKAAEKHCTSKLKTSDDDWFVPAVDHLHAVDKIMEHVRLLSERLSSMHDCFDTTEHRTVTLSVIGVVVQFLHELSGFYKQVHERTLITASTPEEDHQQLRDQQNTMLCTLESDDKDRKDRALFNSAMQRDVSLSSDQDRTRVAKLLYSAFVFLKKKEMGSLFSEDTTNRPLKFLLAVKEALDQNPKPTPMDTEEDSSSETAR